MIDAKVSVIVPVYKVERYLARAVDSLLRQTYTSLEIILVDDGSPDRCPLICDDYAAQEPRVKVIHKPNGGLSDARNFGLDVATGEYITFLDSDDYLSDDAIEILMEQLRSNDADIVCCGCNIIDSEGNIYDHRKGPSADMTGREAAKLLVKDEYPYNFACGKLYRTTLFNEVRFPVGRLYEDIATTYKVVDKARKVYCIDKQLYFYERGRVGNITSELTSSKAAKSYFHGCLNSVERIQYFADKDIDGDIIPILNNQLFVWSKLCIESAMKLGRHAYNEYCSRVESIFNTYALPMPLRLRVILSLKGLYFHVYPLIKHFR